MISGACTQHIVVVPVPSHETYCGLSCSYLEDTCHLCPLKHCVLWCLWWTHVCLHINISHPSGYVMHQQVIQQLYAWPTLHLCFVFVSEQTATWGPCIIYRLALITEMKCVYYAVRSGSLKKAVCVSSLTLILLMSYMYHVPHR
jgi:hypothetical protein